MRIAFIDRDGVINRKAVKGDYVKSWEEFEFLPGTHEGIRALKRAGFLAVVVTNQACVGKGIVSEGQLEAIHSKMQANLLERGAGLDGIYVCPHRHEEGCGCRKPSTGLINRAARDLGAGLAGCVVVGDTEFDKLMADRAGCDFVLANERHPLSEAARKIAGKAGG